MSQPTSVTELCSRDIKKRGFARSNEIAAELSMSIPGVEACLQHLVDQGELVACSLTLGENEIRATEYRLSTLSGGKLLDHSPIGRAPVKPDPVKERLQEWRAPRNPAAAPAAEPERSSPMAGTTKEKVRAALEKHGPMRLKELAKHISDATASAVGQALVAGAGAKPQLFAKLGGGPRSVIWGLPTQTLSKDALEAGAELGRRDQAPRHIHPKKQRRAARKHGRKGRVKRTSAIPVRPSLALKGFRPALAADGAIIFLGAKAGTFEIAREDVRAVLTLSRRLTPGELATTLEFIDTLDKAAA